MTSMILGNLTKQSTISELLGLLHSAENETAFQSDDVEVFAAADSGRVVMRCKTVDGASHAATTLNRFAMFLAELPDGTLADHVDIDIDEPESSRPPWDKTRSGAVPEPATVPVEAQSNASVAATIAATAELTRSVPEKLLYRLVGTLHQTEQMAQGGERESQGVQFKTGDPYKADQLAASYRKTLDEARMLRQEVLSHLGHVESGN